MGRYARALLWVLLITVSMKPSAAFAAYCLVTEEPFPHTAPYDLEECPPEIQAWMDRANGCADLDRQERDDPNLRGELEEARFEMECAYLPCDYQSIQAKYRGNGVLTNIMKGYKKIVYGDKPMVCDEGNRPGVIE